MGSRSSAADIRDNNDNDDDDNNNHKDNDGKVKKTAQTRARETMAKRNKNATINGS